MKLVAISRGLETDLTPLSLDDLAEFTIRPVFLRIQPWQAFLD